MNYSKIDANESSDSKIQTLDATDLLIYRGEKYKENRLKLKEKLSQKEYVECTFKPELNSRSKAISSKSRKREVARKTNLDKIKYRMNGSLEKYINPLEVP